MIYTLYVFGRVHISMLLNLSKEITSTRFRDDYF